jgi:hypothetical protein
MSHANWRLDNPPVVDVAVSRRMGLFVVGRLAARHGVRVRLRHAQAGGLTALIWLPDTVAAPEVAPPLGRLRRFEADDYGPTPSLSAPTATAQGPSAASQATAAARIPRFSPSAPSAPTGPSAPTVPAAPSFSPAANAGAPSSPADPGASAGPGAGAPGQPAKPAAEGTPAGNNWEPAGNGWDLGNGRAATPNAPDAPDGQDGPPTQALPIRNGNGNTVGGSRAQRDDTEPRTPAGGGPSRIPAFGGAVPSVPQAPQSAQGPQFPIGSQNVHGSDGPSARGAANGAAGPAPGDQADGQVTVPPSGQEQRLPIFDSLESDWFRRSGKTMTGPQRALGSAAPQPASQGTWTSPADEGWRAAQVVASPAAGETTQAGLPRRVPRANLVPGSVGSGGQGSQDAVAEAPARSADVARSRMSSFQRGVREGRAAAPQVEEP